ncbi:MAG: hypothetical protein ACP5MB_11165, partial [bacterium]
MNTKDKRILEYIGVILFLIGTVNFMVTYLGLTTLSVSSSSSNGMSFTIHSSNPNQGLLLASVDPVLINGYTYNWEMTIQNTGAVPFYGHGTIRIAGPSASYQEEPGVSGYLGANGGTGAVQVCGGEVNSTSCLVNLQDWDLSVNGTGASVSFNSADQVAAINLPEELAPGQSETVYFSIKPPSGTAGGQYLAIFNFVGESGGVSNVLGYQVVPIDVGTMAAKFSVEEIGSLVASVLG